MLKQYEVIIDITSKQLLQNEIYKDKNLLQEKETKESFLEVLNSDSAVLGRTYYNALFKKVIIPIRKAIRDENKNVVFVVSLVIDIEKAFNFFTKINTSESNYSLSLYRDKDRYFQIAPIKRYKDPAIYKYKFPIKVVENQIKEVEKKYNISFEEIKSKELISHFLNRNSLDAGLMSSYYINEYGLWISIESKLSLIKDTFYKISALIILIFLSIISLIFWFFKIIRNNEIKENLALTYQANHDYLTGLHNRHYLDYKSSHLQSENRPFYLFFIDMDNFKSINDMFGHQYGDKVLIEISRRLLSLKKDKDILVRYSGDEFLLFSYTLNNNEVNQYAKKILSLLSKPYKFSNNKFQLTAAIGISNFPKDGKNLDDIKRYADLALYKSKSKKNSFTHFTKGLKLEYLKNIDLAHKMKESLVKEEFYIVYQPQVCNNQNICGLEALLRWETKDSGFVGPDIFIPVAESSDQMVKLGNYVIKKSLEEIKTLEEVFKLNISLSINISVKQFIDDDFINFLLKTIEETGFNKNNLQLEITENVFIEDINYIINILDKLREFNIKVSLDDFGTGFSSLSLLNKLPIDELKIDKSFVDDILNNETSKTMVESIIAIAKKMNLSIVAEGIEDIEQKNLLETMGCDLYQGYFYSKPLVLKELKKYIIRNQKKY